MSLYMVGSELSSHYSTHPVCLPCLQHHEPSKHADGILIDYMHGEYNVHVRNKN